MNTDQSDKKVTHWWSYALVEFLGITYKKEIFLFDSFGFEGFKEFTLDDDRNLLNTILYGIEKFD